jgi:MFS family permease
VADESLPVLADFFDGEFDARVFAFLAVVEHRNDPRNLNPFRVVGGVVVGSVIGELLHGGTLRWRLVPVTLHPIRAAFIGFGFFAGAWAVAAVDIEREFDLTDAQLGFLLAAGVVFGTLFAAFGGALTDRFGAGHVLARALAIWGALIAVQAFAPTLGVFAPAFTLGLAAGGLVDVVMNVIGADALATEPARLVRLHGLYNGGAVLGASACGVALHFEVSWRVIWVAVAVFAVGLAVWTDRSQVPEPAKADHPSMLRAVAGLRHEGLLVVALVFAGAAMVEGGIATWGVLYLREHVGLGVLAGVAAYVVGQSLATLTRISGTPVIEKLGTRRTIAGGAALAAAGLFAVALSDVAGLAATGLAAASVGITVVWPLLIADVSNQARHPALAIGGVTAAGYVGLMAGPFIIGIMSSAVSLQAGLILLAAVALAVAITPARIRETV